MLLLFFGWRQVFTSIALFNMLISPLNAFPWVLNGLMEAWVSVKRIQAFLSLDNLDLTGYYQQLDCSDKGESKSIVVYSNLLNMLLSVQILQKRGGGGGVKTRQGVNQKHQQNATLGAKCLNTTVLYKTVKRILEK